MKDFINFNKQISTINKLYNLIPAYYACYLNMYRLFTIIENKILCEKWIWNHKLKNINLFIQLKQSLISLFEKTSYSMTNED